ncbi:MAG: hypothetical protein WA021_00445 [Minisyncoccia bacterium]
MVQAVNDLTPKGMLAATRRKFPALRDDRAAFVYLCTAHGFGDVAEERWAEFAPTMTALPTIVRESYFVRVHGMPTE